MFLCDIILVAVLGRITTKCDNNISKSDYFVFADANIVISYYFAIHSSKKNIKKFNTYIL